MIVSIHQPNYLPWLGYFHKIANSDIFVIFDDVQLSRGKDFVVRNLIKTKGGPKWLRVPVKDKNKMLLINQVKINNELDWSKKHLNSLKSNYQKAPFFITYYEEIEEILSKKNEFLLELNLELIKFFMKILKIDTKIIYSSELNVDTFGTEKILKIIQAVKGDKYLTGEGKGSQRYIEGKDDLFKNEGIKMLHQNFQFPYYSQLYDEFIPNLSICDMLFNIGAEKISTEINEQKIKF